MSSSNTIPSIYIAISSIYKVEACARAAHEVNRAYCLALGDGSQLAWDNAPEWQQASARKGVQGVLDGNTPEQSHESWLEEKRATGWRYGPTKDASAKTHPCFVPYAELPAEQQQKDHLFVATVRAMATALELWLRPATPVVEAPPT